MGDEPERGFMTQAIDLPPVTPDARLRSCQAQVFWLLWGAYASYYLCRVNFAVAQPVILKEFPTWTSTQIGTIPSTYAAVYAVGQIVNGTLGQRYGTRRLMTVGLLAASVTNCLFSFCSSLGAMRLLWACNGWFQSAGWSLMVHTLSNWNTSARRGILIGQLSTCYTVGNVLSWLLAGLLCQSLGWRAAFLVPSLLLLPMAAVFFLFLRNSPDEAGFPPVRDDVGQQAGAAAVAPGTQDGWESTWRIVATTLRNPVLWILAIGFFVMNAVRYTFMNWSVQYMADFHGRSIKNSALTAIMIPLAGSLGALSAGWASDKLFGKRRAPVCIVMMLGLAGVCGAMTLVPPGRWVAATALLGLAGFMIYGPDVLMSGVATVDLSHPKAGSIATGLTMCLGALGAIFSGAGVGYLKDLGHGNWSLVFWVLAALPLFPALLMATIWNARPKGAK
jgi:OPA family sugar phosphate sensor protein UhpC-like MFS transporter